jgi:hypothetical protein
MADGCGDTKRGSGKAMCVSRRALWTLVGTRNPGRAATQRKVKQIIKPNANFRPNEADVN